jgi:hypothetical protein
LKDSINQVRAMSAAQMKVQADFTWCFDSCPESPKGLGQICIIPSGFLVCRVSKHFIGLTRNFGAFDAKSCQLVNKGPMNFKVCLTMVSLAFRVSLRGL